MAAENLVRYEVYDGVALLTWDRSHRRNAWSLPLQTAYFDALDEATRDSAVVAIVVTGVGSTFCPGGDMEILQAAGGKAEPEGVTSDDPRVPTYPLSVPKPTIAAINGACAGIGLLQALALDVRFASSDAKFTTAFTRIGLVAEGGASILLNRLVGVSRSMDLLLSARQIDADEAVSMGLVTHLSSPSLLVDDAVRYASALVRCSPAAMAIVKSQVLEELRASVDIVRAEEERLTKIAMKGPDFIEGVASFVEKRAPIFPRLGFGTRFD